MRRHFGSVLAFVCIAFFVADMVTLHIAARECGIQSEPAVHHDWDALLDSAHSL